MVGSLVRIDQDSGPRRFGGEKAFALEQYLTEELCAAASESNDYLNNLMFIKHMVMIKVPHCEHLFPTMKETFAAAHFLFHKAGFVFRLLKF
jgi:hypothetical protein